MFLADEQPLLPEEEEDVGYGMIVVRPAEFPDPAEQEKKEAEILFYPSVSSSKSSMHFPCNMANHVFGHLQAADSQVQSVCLII